MVTATLTEIFEPEPEQGLDNPDSNEMTNGSNTTNEKEEIIRNIEWKDKNIKKIHEKEPVEVEFPLEHDKKDALINNLSREIEPWLSALFQSEHLSLLVGAGLTMAVESIANRNSNGAMKTLEFSQYKEQIDIAAKKSAEKTNRGVPNIEDQIRVVNNLIAGLDIFTSIYKEDSNAVYREIYDGAQELKKELRDKISVFSQDILKSENAITQASDDNASGALVNFLSSFASRSATRERLNIFTTNYDRVIEFGAELAGIRLIDRFVGTISPVFRSSRLKVDMHYNPPGIRGEPRYLEGVAYMTKLHGSLDWIYKDGYVRRIALPYGAKDISLYFDKGETIMIYPNSSKDRETAEYPYVELFRDLAAAICRPNSTLVVYGYSFGDEHINRVIKDMLTIPSTHIVIIAYNDDTGRIFQFYNDVDRSAQMTLLIGKDLGDLKILVDNYLPKPAIDKATIRMADLLKARGWAKDEEKRTDIDETQMQAAQSGSQN